MPSTTDDEDTPIAASDSVEEEDDNGVEDEEVEEVEEDPEEADEEEEVEEEEEEEVEEFEEEVEEEVEVEEEEGAEGAEVEAAAAAVVEEEEGDDDDDDDMEEVHEEEEEEEEEEEVEEEEEEEEEKVEEDLSDSLSPLKDRSDYSQEEGHVEDLQLEKSKPTLVSNDRDTKETDGCRDSLDPPNQPTETHGKELSHVSDGDSKQVSSKGLDTSGDIGLLESVADHKVTESQREEEALIQEKFDDVDGSNQGHSITSKANQAEKSKRSCVDEKVIAAESTKRDGLGYKESNSDLHMEEGAKHIDTDSREDVNLRASSSLTPQIRPRSFSPGVELEDRNKRPAIICDFFARGWCIKGSSCRFLHQKDGLDNTSNCSKGDVPIASSKAEIKKDAGARKEADVSKSSASRENRRDQFLNKHGSESPVKFPLLHKHRLVSGGPVLSSSNFGTSPAFNSSLSSSFNSSLQAYASKSSLPRSSSSPFYLRSEAENLSTRSSLGDTFTSRGHVTPFTPYSWEPSVPFRPSFNLSSIISSAGTQYDPLRDYIEPPNAGDGSFKSPFSKGLTIHQNSIHQTNASLDQQPQRVVSDKIPDSHSLGVYTTTAEATGTVAPEHQIHILTTKEDRPIKRHVRNTSHTKEMDLDRNPSHQVDGGRQNKESKALKHFRASLVEFVKELVKPFWRDGHLSKDAHNMVVKKAVEKVLSAIQPHQIPTTSELTNQYLSSSQPKIAKLVEGYVGKYTKA